MDRKDAEKTISGLLEVIRGICADYLGADFDMCSMHVSPKSKSAFVLKEHDGEGSEYLLKFYEMEDDDE